MIGNVLATREKLRERFTSQEEIEDDGRQGNEADIISAEDRAFIDRLKSTSRTIFPRPPSASPPLPERCA